MISFRMHSCTRLLNLLILLLLLLTVLVSLWPADCHDDESNVYSYLIGSALVVPLLKGTYC
jgi:hypothetical protein